MTKLLPDGPIDTLGLRAATLALPEQVASAGAGAPVAGLAATTDIDHVLLVAPGEALAAGEITAVLAAPIATIPIVVASSGTLPASVTARSLVVVAALDDHPAALAAMRAAADRHAPGVVVAPTGSAAAALAEQEGWSHVPAAFEVPVARAGVAGLVVHLLAVLEQLGQYAGLTSSAAAAIEQLEVRRTELDTESNPARRLATRIGRTLPIVYGSDALTGAAARHWKRQVNLNAKAAAFAAALPTLGAAEISGWGQHGDMTRQVFTLVTLRHDHEPAGTVAAMAMVDELVDEVVHERHEVRAAGDGSLAQVLDLVFQADVTTWHLAQALEIDPGPTAAVAAISAVASEP